MKIINSGNGKNMSFVLLIFLCCLLILVFDYCTANDTLTVFQRLSVSQTLVSAGQIFELGFFSPAGSANKVFVGIWLKNGLTHKSVWVANRGDPLAADDKNSSLMFDRDGNLIVVDGKQRVVWSTNVSVPSNNTIAQLTDKGNFVLRDVVSQMVLWQSFDSPVDTILPTMMIGFNDKTGQKFISSWKTNSDPSPGEFVVGISHDRPPQVFIWRNSKPYWRSGPWNGGKFIGIPDLTDDYSNGIVVTVDNPGGASYLSFTGVTAYSNSHINIVTITPEGSLKTLEKEPTKNEWRATWETPRHPCDIYSVCGPFGVSDKNASPICKCLKGFVPNSPEEWSAGNWTSGCVRRTELECTMNTSNSSLEGSEKDGFLKLSTMKLPDHFKYLYSEDAQACEKHCSSDCSCLAYAYPARIGCMVWTTDLKDIQLFSSSGEDLFLRLAGSELGRDKKPWKVVIAFAPVFIIVIIIIFFSICAFFCSTRKANNRGNELPKKSSDLPILEFVTVAAATNNFGLENKLGEGGFGTVYRGKLEGGQEIAVKRLSSHSGQGVEEFKNEALLISKLQHRNLVRLLGCCIHGEEKLLMYEYMKNKSLDNFLFDPRKVVHLDWTKRFNIIQGVARGLLYLHRDSCLRIIHRDLKASNILLDEDMNPKISDFGLARTFQIPQEIAKTYKIAGTLGYMSPEYAIGGLFSEKSDVYSFGVLVLEIISSRKNSRFYYDEKYLSLIGYAWELWKEGREMELMDQLLGPSWSLSEVTRCIKIGLLCVQDVAAERPTMSDVVFMLNNEVDLPRPKQPTFSFQCLRDSDIHSWRYGCSINEVTISMIEGR